MTKKVYIYFVALLGITLSVIDFTMAQSLYIATGVGILTALVLNIFPGTQIFARWWNLAPMVGVFLGGLAFDRTQNWILGALAGTIGVGVYIYCLMRSAPPAPAPAP